MVTIRPYTPADATAISHILCICIAEGGSMAMNPDFQPDAEWTATAMSYRTAVYVAVDGDRVVGYVTIDARGGTYAHTGILSIALLPSHRGRGIGRRLMDAMIGYACDQAGLERIELEVFATNQRAICLYESVGFVEEGRRRHAHNERGEYIDMVMMGMLRSEYESRKGSGSRIAVVPV